MTDAIDIPVLVTMFNRPEHASRVLEALGRVRPKRVFLAVDGPREDRPEDAAGVEACRRLVDSIGWECEVRTRFREVNLGCRRGMIDGVSWFFGEVDRGVVLEDDCVPAASFLPYAAAVFDRFAEDSRFMQLAGYAHVENPRSCSYFLPLTCSWGWGTTRRVWTDFARAEHELPEEFEANSERHEAFDLGGIFPYSRMFRRSVAGKISSWAVLFYWYVFRSSGLVAYPAESLIRNIGFDGSGTHGRGLSASGEELAEFAPSAGALPDGVKCDEEMFALVKARLKR